MAKGWWVVGGGGVRVEILAAHKGGKIMLTRRWGSTHKKVEPRSRTWRKVSGVTR